MPQGFDKLKKEPRGDNNRIVIEGIDEPKREGAYSDRIKIDPYAPNYTKKFKNQITRT